ncbi:MAG TPA: hypothetical protein PL117_03850, partial [Accumulibacter sp.]|uniref:hypothetical protein n=1 Tax=Accumulibacter sp. TaxID=2053492 RepID=UPI002C321CFD
MTRYRACRAQQAERALTIISGGRDWQGLEHATRASAGFAELARVAYPRRIVQIVHLPSPLSEFAQRHDRK